jgi:hypothetical protein
LEGFEGYHGELRALWDRVAKNSRELSVRMMANDRLWEDRNKREGAREKWKGYKMVGEPRGENALESGEMTAEIIEEEANAFVEAAEAKDRSRSEQSEEGLEMMKHALLDTKPELDGDGVEKTAEGKEQEQER